MKEKHGDHKSYAEHCRLNGKEKVNSGTPSSTEELKNLPLNGTERNSTSDNVGDPASSGGLDSIEH